MRPLVLARPHLNDLAPALPRREGQPTRVHAARLQVDGVRRARVGFQTKTLHLLAVSILQSTEHPSQIPIQPIPNFPVIDMNIQVSIVVCHY